MVDDSRSLSREVTPIAGPSASSLQAELQSELARLCNRHGWPGATAAIRGRRGDASAAAGLSDREGGVPMRVGDRLMPASVGKLIIAAVAVRLAHAGQLDLDTPVARWLDRAAWWPRKLSAQPMTVRQLLQHRAGLRDYPDLRAFASWYAAKAERDASSWLSPEEAVVMACADGLVCAPDTLTVYSDTGYLLAGLAIEACTGRRYYELAVELILTPAGMSSTHPNDTRRLAGLVQGYGNPAGRFAGGGSVIDGTGQLRYDPRTEWSGGGFVSTAEDLRALLFFLFDGGLPPGVVERMLRGAHPIYDRTPAAHYGLGVVITTTSLGPSLGHTGSIPGYRTLAAYFPAQRAAVAVMINSDAADWSMLHEARESLGSIAAQA